MLYFHSIIITNVYNIDSKSDVLLLFRKNPGLVRMRFIESDDNLAMRRAPLKEAIENDIKLGLIPFWVSLTCFALQMPICSGLIVAAWDLVVWRDGGARRFVNGFHPTRTWFVLSVIC